MNPVFQLTGGFVGEGEGNDVRRCYACGTFLAKDVDDTLGNDLSFAGTGAGDDLEVAVQVIDRFLLVWCVFHCNSSTGFVSWENAFPGKAEGLIPGNYDVVQYLDIKRSQRLDEQASKLVVLLGRLRRARRVVVG